MEKIKINGTQMFMLVVLFEMGSAIVVGIAASAKQDAWISIMLGMVAGVLLFFVYYRLYQFYPDLPLTNYVQKITGKWIGRIISFLYVIYFIYDASRVLRDFSELLTTTMYTSTPQLVLNSLMILTIMYAIKKGFEVIARIAQFYFGFIYLVAITGFLLILMSGILHFENLRPVFRKWMEASTEKLCWSDLGISFRGDGGVYNAPSLFKRTKKGKTCMHWRDCFKRGKHCNYNCFQYCRVRGGPFYSSSISVT